MFKRPELQGNSGQNNELGEYQKRSITYLNDRILIYFLGVGFIGPYAGMGNCAQSTVIQLGSLIAAVIVS